MGDVTRVGVGDTSAKRRPPIKRSGAPGLSTLVGVAAGAVSVAAMLICAALAVVFAATLAVVMVLASLLLALAGLAWRLQSRPAFHGVAIRQRSGHAWITYDWNRHAR